MPYTLAKTCLFCIPSQFVALCNPFRSGNQRHGNLVAEHELRQAATRICRATCMLVCTRLKLEYRGIVTQSDGTRKTGTKKFGAQDLAATLYEFQTMNVNNKLNKNKMNKTQMR